MDVKSKINEEADSFSSASFSSDSELEGKVSLGSPPLQNSSQKDKHGKGGKKQTDSKQDNSSKLGFVLRDARFFIMKSNNEENIQLSKKMSVWSTPPANEFRINQAVRDTRNVILIFSVKESGKFSGFARLNGESDRGGQPINWILPPGLTQRALGGVLPLEWISKHELSFLKTQHLFNPWNDGKPVKIGRDGQEVEPHVGSELCRLFPQDVKTDWDRIIRQSKEAVKRVNSTRIIGPLGSPIPSSSNSRNNFRDGRSDHRRRMDQTSSSMPRHTRSSYDSVRVLSGEKRRSEDDYNRSKRIRNYDDYYGDKRGDMLNQSSRYIHSQSQDRSYGISQRRKYSYTSSSRDAYHRPPPPPMPYPPPPPFDSFPPLPRYYDIPALADGGHHLSRGHNMSSTRAKSDRYFERK